MDRYIYRSNTFWKFKTAKNIETMNVLNTRPMKVAPITFKKYINRYIYWSDTFWTLKNAKNIKTMNLLNTRPMEVALRYI